MTQRHSSQKKLTWLVNDFRECWKLQLCSSKIIPLWIFCWLNLLYILNYSCSNKMCAREVQCLKEYFGIFFNVMSMYSFLLQQQCNCVCMKLHVSKLILRSTLHKRGLSDNNCALHCWLTDFDTKLNRIIHQEWKLCNQ